jgi:hypothetical protein
MKISDDTFSNSLYGSNLIISAFRADPARLCDDKLILAAATWKEMQILEYAMFRHK